MQYACHWYCRIGYALIRKLPGCATGTGLLLTSLFVCQPNYSATRALRSGVGRRYVGLPILWFVPSLEGQLVLLVITGVLFFAFRNVQYAQPTCSSPLVLLCFNLWARL